MMDSSLKSSSGSKDAASLALLALSLVTGVIELFYKPFGFAPISFLAVLIGVTISNKNRTAGLATTGIVTLCFVVGAAAAVWSSRALY